MNDNLVKKFCSKLKFIGSIAVWERIGEMCQQAQHDSRNFLVWTLKSLGYSDLYLCMAAPCHISFLHLRASLLYGFAAVGSNSTQMSLDSVSPLLQGLSVHPKPRHTRFKVVRVDAIFSKILIGESYEQIISLFPFSLSSMNGPERQLLWFLRGSAQEKQQSVAYLAAAWEHIFILFPLRACSLSLCIHLLFAGTH